MRRLSGVTPPVPTFFGPDGKLDLDASRRHADFLLEQGVDGLAILGTSGEFSTLTLAEKEQFIKAVAAHVSRRANIIVGVGDTCLEHVLQLMRICEEADVDALLLINPYFSVYSEEMVEAYFDAAANATRLPIIIYNFPGLTGFDFHTELVKRLVQKHKNIKGIKETVADPEHIRSMLTVKEISPEFLVFVAYENQAMTALPLGTDGFINATANFAPEFTVRTYMAYRAGELALAVAWSKKMSEAMEIYKSSTPLFLACKEAVYQRLGIHSCTERLPALPLGDAAKATIAEELKKLGIESPLH